MSCYHPLKGFITGVTTENGKMRYYVTEHYGDYVPVEEYKKRFGEDLQPNEYTRVVNGRLSLFQYVPIPCGKCFGCRLDYSRKWAVRCCLEAASHRDNCFVTLTYSDKTTFDNPEIPKRDAQLFLKRLRKFCKGSKVRYLLCYELGEKSRRPHFHAIIFGYRPVDLEPFFNRDGNTYYKSKSLEAIWKHGNILIGECNFKTCAYTARYCLKKVGQGEGFLLTSRRPGLGAAYFFDHAKDIYATDKVYFNFGDFYSIKPPQYFDRLLEKEDPETLEYIKEARRLISSSSLEYEKEVRGLDEVDLLWLKEDMKKEHCKLLRRPY